MATESLIPLVKDNPNRNLLESLGKNSALLQRLEKEFGNVFGARYLQIVSFYETEKSSTAVKVNCRGALCFCPEVLLTSNSDGGWKMGTLWTS